MKMNVNFSWKGTRRRSEGLLSPRFFCLYLDPGIVQINLNAFEESPVLTFEDQQWDCRRRWL